MSIRDEKNDYHDCGKMWEVWQGAEFWRTVNVLLWLHFNLSFTLWLWFIEYWGICRNERNNIIHFNFLISIYHPSGKIYDSEISSKDAISSNNGSIKNITLKCTKL